MTHPRMMFFADRLVDWIIAALVGAFVMLCAMDAAAQTVGADLRMLQWNHQVCTWDYVHVRNGTLVGRDQWGFPPSFPNKAALDAFCTDRVLAHYRATRATEDRLLQGIIDSAGSGVRQAPGRQPHYQEKKEYKNVEADKMIEQFSAGLR